MLRKFSSALALMLAPSLHAAVITLKFEGIGDYNFVDNYYAGDGIIFAPDQFGGNALVATSLAGGGLSEFFFNEPSPNSVMSFLSPFGSQATPKGTINVARGFDTGFSLFYSSSRGATIQIYSDVDGRGSVLGSIRLGVQYDTGCIAAQRETYCNWTPAGATFAGLARSVVFTGEIDFTAYDNMTFGSAIPTGVPEPASLALMMAGLGFVAGAARRGRAAS